MSVAQPTQRDMTPNIAAELEAAGFAEAVEIGRGGFGVVYRCVEQALGRTVAVKVLSADLDEENRERFLREERAMGRLSGHPNIVGVLRVDVTVTGRPYIVMPFHSRGSLEALIARSGPLGWEAAVRLGVKLCGAVETAHRAGILHRDIKPGNVLLTSYGEPELTDFGVARMRGAFETGSDAITGSPAYTAPEVLKGAPPTAASDVYGLGATLFAALTGHAAFERRTGEKVVTQFLRITTEDVPDLREKGIPPDVAEVIEDAMAVEPILRPESACELGEQLRAIELAHNVPVDDMALPPAVEDDDRLAGPASMVSAFRRRTSTAHVQFSAAAEVSNTPPPSASTKYRPPAYHRAVLRRTRLLDTLRAGSPRRLTMIHGPAGTGKATLAAQWRDDLIADGMPVAWLRVDEDDNTAVWFLAHLVEAIARVRPDLGVDLDPERAEDTEKYLLSSLIDKLGEHDEPIVVVIDDWHHVTSDAARSVVDQLLDSENLRLVITSANRTGLPLSRLQVRDELVEIDWQDLRLDPDEARELLVERNQLDLSDVAVAVLQAATEGWLAALQLASLSLQAHLGKNHAAGPTEVINGLTTRRIDEYIANNVLADVDDKMIGFLMSVAITERVNGELASVLAGVPDGQALLEDAEERDLFLRRVDDDPQWFRLHPLFADYLRRRFQRERPGRIRVLHLHASEWFAQHKQMDEAVEHALAAADPALADADDIEHPRMAALLSLLAKLPNNSMVSRSRLMMAAAKANVALRQSDTARTAWTKVTTWWDRL